MAVITPLSSSDIEQFLAPYELGPLLAVEPSEAGIENTTYFITTGIPEGQAEWVLTLIEHAPIEQVDFTAQLLTFLHGCGLPVPAPLRDRTGRPWRQLHGKPTWLIERVQGRHPTVIRSDDCHAIGDFLGAAHRAAERFDTDHGNSRGPAWLRRTASELQLGSEHDALLAAQVARWEALRDEPLPRGAIHADLFHDNALFRQKRLVAVIDFLFCCTDWLLLDVAIAVNDWCDDGRGQLDAEKTHALLAAYSRHRPFTPAEQRHWPAILALAATRFWVSRLQPSSDQQTKNPDTYLTILKNRLSLDVGETIPLPLIL